MKLPGSVELLILANLYFIATERNLSNQIVSAIQLL